VEKRLRRKVEEALAGVLGASEQLLVGTNALHPKFAFGVGMMASILIGALVGSAVESATDWGPASLWPLTGAMVALVARWLYVFRRRSELQPAGAMPLVGLTTERLIFIETDFWGRATGATHTFPVSRVAEIALKKRLSGLFDAVLRTGDNQVIHYQIRYADRIKDEIDRRQP